MRRIGIVLLFAMLCCAGCGTGDAPFPHYTTAVTGPRIALDDPNLFLSPYNWTVNGATSALSTQPGAYLSAAFHSSAVRLDIDTSSYMTASDKGGPRIRWQVDAGTLHTYQLVAGDVQIPLSTDALDPATDHTCKVWIVSSNFSQDRWKVPVQAVRITGLTLDAGGKSVAPTLLANRALFYGDSITEGVRTESARKDPIHDGDATHAYTYTCAAALGAEFGVVGMARQGWTIPGQEGSNVPPFSTAWQSYFAGKPRIFTPKPDYVIVMHGVNDALAPADTTQVRVTVQKWITEARSAMPAARICIVIPFNGFERESITQGVLAYQAANKTDTKVFLIDLGTFVQTGLTDPSGTPSQHSHDGIHPDAATSQALGVTLSTAILKAAGM